MIVTFKERKELFKSDCKVINLDFEYQSSVCEVKGCLGDKKWAIITNLPENELMDRYSDFLKCYTPFVLLSVEQGKAIKDYFMNEDKFLKRQIHNEYIFGFDEVMLERTHSEISVPDYWDYIEEYNAREAIYDLLMEALNTLTITQRRRLIKHIVYRKTLREIANEENVNYTKIDRSVKTAMKKIKKFFENRGTFRGANSK